MKAAIVWLFSFPKKLDKYFPLHEHLPIKQNYRKSLEFLEIQKPEGKMLTVDWDPLHDHLIVLACFLLIFLFVLKPHELFSYLYTAVFLQMGYRNKNVSDLV